MHHHIETVVQSARLCPADIRKLKDITIVVSEQVLSFAMDVADRLFVIEGGRLVHETARIDTDEQHIKAYLSV